MLKLLDLFSGIGGFSLGLESTGGFETIAFVEKDDFCQKVLKKHWPNTTIEGDIRNVKGDKYEADVITGGFPCQPFSVAGKRKGVDDDRYLWDETIRVVRECKPKWFIGENVEGLININNGVVLRQVQTDLEKEGFEVQCLVIPASGIGAWHQRKRIWIMGYSKHNGRSSIKIKGRNDKTNDNSEKRENQTSEFERTSGPINNGNVRMDATNSISTRSGRGRISGNVDKQGRNAFEAERKSIQSKNEQTCSDDVEQNGQDVSDTNSIGHRGRSVKRCSIQKWTFLPREQKGREVGSKIKGCNEYVSDTNGDREKWNKSKNRKGWWFESFNNSEDVSNSESKRTRKNDQRLRESFGGINGREGTNVSNSSSKRSSSQSIGVNRELAEESKGEKETRNQSTLRTSSSCSNGTKETWWQTESRICGVPNGVSFELDKSRNNRIKSLGNSIVPQIVRELGFAILEAEKND